MNGIEIKRYEQTYYHQNAVRVASVSKLLAYARANYIQNAAPGGAHFLHTFSRMVSSLNYVNQAIKGSKTFGRTWKFGRTDTSWENENLQDDNQEKKVLESPEKRVEQYDDDHIFLASEVVKQRGRIIEREIILRKNQGSLYYYDFGESQIRA